jgi:lycopene beta-cyclase
MVYDYIIAGAGAAGMQLALAMVNDVYFANKTILIVEPSEHGHHDKRWCYWETESKEWDHLIEYHWEKAAVRTQEGNYVLNLPPYSYKMLRAGHFFAYAKERLMASPTITWCTDRIISVQSDVYPLCLQGEQGMYFAHHVFDSRVEEPSPEYTRHQVNLVQHFLGWEVETDTDVFNPEQVELMDFCFAKPDTCSFMYVLPYSKRKALVEFTAFTPNVWEEAVYEAALREYLNKVSYKVVGKEAGVIPMSTVPFHKTGNEHHTKIGTAGSWVKPSTGYSFTSSGEKINQVIANIKADRPVSENLIRPRFRYYDRLLLDILERDNARGQALFDTLYKNNKIDLLFRFLDEKTTFKEELLIMSRFNPLPFLYSILRSFRAKWL